MSYWEDKFAINKALMTVALSQHLHQRLLLSSDTLHSRPVAESWLPAVATSNDAVYEGAS